jgi:phospholipid/cholesterol/gamma-HCH transport system substrate-binding protein
MADPIETLSNSEPSPLKPVRNLERKAAALLAFTVLLIAGSVLYLLHSRGAFEPTQQLVLVSDDAEGVAIGMDMTFSGFPIGRVHAVELAEGGKVHIVIDVPRKDAHWLRSSSVFTLVRGLVGGTTIKAFTGLPDDPPLADGAERPVLRGDATAELPQVLSNAKEVLANAAAITSQEGELRATLVNLRELSERLKSRDADKVAAALDKANALLARLDSTVAKADTQVFGPDGVMKEARATVVQLNQLLADTRASLKKVDAVLTDAQGISANVRGATTDLGALRTEVDANLHKIEGMIDQLNRRWPFARDTEVKLP